MQAAVAGLFDKHKSTMQTTRKAPPSSASSAMDCTDNAGNSAHVETKTTHRNVDMESVSSSPPSSPPSVHVREGPIEYVQFDSGDSDEDEGMSVLHGPCEPERWLPDGSARSNECSRRTRGVGGVVVGPTVKYDSAAGRARNARLSCAARCVRCEAYDAHCKKAAENYRRVLGKYTKTVSELMVGFRSVLDRYPDLKTDCADERVHYIVEAALGRKNLIQEMIKINAKEREIARRDLQEPGARSQGSRDRDAAAAPSCGIVEMQEALRACYSDSEAVRLLLGRYSELFVRYVQVWQGMCAKITRELSLAEFMDLTRGRPGATKDGEPWLLAQTFLSRMIHKAKSLSPRTFANACRDTMSKLSADLTVVPTANFIAFKDRIDRQVAQIRTLLDDNGTSGWQWDAFVTDLYLDIRSDLAVVETLVDVGELSAKTLLYERSMLVTKMKQLTLNEATLQTRLSATQADLREKTLRLREQRQGAFSFQM